MTICIFFRVAWQWFVLSICIVALVACSKKDQQTVPLLSGQFPQKITIKFYDGPKLLKNWNWVVDPASTQFSQLLFWTDSTYEDSVGFNEYYKTKQFIEWGDDGLMRKMYSNNFSSGTISLSTNTVQPGNHYINNYSVAIDKSKSPGALGTRHFQIQLYFDSLQRAVSFIGAVDITADPVTVSSIRNVVNYYTSAGGTDDWLFSRDSIVLKEQWRNGPAHLPIRWYYYFTEEQPGYTMQPWNETIFYRRSFYACDSFVLQNGNRNSGTFQPGLIRKTVYEYNSDTTSIPSFLALINPVLKDPVWFFTSFYGHIFTTWNAREGGNYDDFYNWMMTRSADSVFLVNPDGKRVLQNVTVSNNATEKDAQGRVTRIIQHRGNDSRFKIMEIFY